MPGVAVVTGAGRGFGREIAKRLAARGYTVLATDIVMGLLDSKQLVLVIPRWRGWLARSTALMGRHAIAGAELLRKLGERRRARG